MVSQGFTAERGYTKLHIGGTSLAFSSCKSHYRLKSDLQSESLKGSVKAVRLNKVCGRAGLRWVYSRISKAVRDFWGSEK